MSTSIRVYLHHILNETQYLIDQSEGLTQEAFLDDGTRQRAFVRSLEIPSLVQEVDPPRVSLCRMQSPLQKRVVRTAHLQEP